ncbi:MAG: DNA recombination/repair protein RecA, partial [Anaerolineales bacterium]
SKVGDILDLGVELGVIEKRGSFFTYQGDQRIGQGRESARQALKQNPVLAAELEAKIRAAANLNAPPAVVEEAEAEPEEVG